MSDASGTTLQIWLQRIDAQARTGRPQSRPDIVSIIFRPTPAAPAIAAAFLRTRFDLTAQEAEVLTRPAGGSSIKSICRQLEIKLSTARSHLTQCRAKTGAHNQRDLVRLVLSLESPILE